MNGGRPGGTKGGERPPGAPPREKTAMVSAGTPECWRWTESNWGSPDLDWRTARFVAAGIDVGWVSSQAVLLADGRILGYANRRTGSNSPDSARRALRCALDVVAMPADRIDGCVGTGYGRVNVPFADPAILAEQLLWQQRGASGSAAGVQSPAGGLSAFELREPSGAMRMIQVHWGNATAWLASGSVGDLDGVGGCWGL